MEKFTEEEFEDFLTNLKNDLAIYEDIEEGSLDRINEIGNKVRISFS